MKKLLFISIVASWLISCVTTKKNIQSNSELNGVYKLKSDKLFQAFSDLNYHSLELKPDGVYILKKAEIKFTPVIEQCEIASKGRWATISNDVLELTSEEKYEKPKGFEYEIKKENRYSQDSLYIQVNFPDSVEELPIKLHFGFNSNNSKSIETEKTFVVLPKSKYLWPKTSNSVNRNNISFYLEGNVSSKGRNIFEIFEEEIDTEKSNYLTINLPNFDRCFFEFEPLNKDLIYIKNKTQLFWQGAIWEK